VRALLVSSLAVALAAWLVAVFGCEGDSQFVIPPWDAGSVDTRHAAACAAWAQSVCDYETRCPPPIRVRWGSLDQCQSRAVLACELVAGDPNVVFDDGAVAGCRYPQECSTPVPLTMCLPPGRSPEGAPCLSHASCADGACNVSPTPNGGHPVCGTCLRFVTCPLTCDAGDLCLPNRDGGLACTTLPAPGEACDVFCRSDALCMPADGGSVCVALGHLGDACGGSNGPPACAGVDTLCDDSGHCSAYLPAAYGATCGVGSGGPSYECLAYGVCDSLGTGLCIPPAPDGALCDDQQGLGCLPPARCIEHHCLYPNVSYCSP
jgi:hypothetical protein